MSSIRLPIDRIQDSPRSVALAAGALAACGFQPLGLWPVTLIAVACWIEAVSRAQGWRAALLIGWLFGVGHFTIGNYWIATSFTYQANMPHWLGSLAVVALSLYLAVYPAMAALAAWRLSRWGGGSAGIGLALGAAWIVTEWMRGFVFTGFAWNPLGIAMLGGYETQGLALTAKWIGTYGLSGLLVLIAAALRHGSRMASIAKPGQRAAGIAGGVAVAIGLAALMTAPALYLARSEGAQPFTLVQPDLRQEFLADPGLVEANFRRLAKLTAPLMPNDKRVVFWPESGVPDYLRDGYPAELYRDGTYGADPALARGRLARVIGPYSLLLTGAVDAVIEGEDWVAVRNSVTAVDWRGNIVAGYAKAHLVPYGEYLPMRTLLEPLGLSRLVPGTLDFVPGPGPRSYDFGDWGEAGIQLCYEIVFSGEVVDPANRPDYIFNPTNDGWFGSWGPPQHLAQARLRALEEGLPVMRSTTTGISAVIDADGIVRQHIEHHRAGRIDGMIPPAAEPTLFARYGNVTSLLFAGLLLAVCLVAMWRARR